MPVPPILDVFVVWHPEDEDGPAVFQRLHRHFHSAAFSGLAGGAIEVYSRSAGWKASDAAPRPLLLPGQDGSALQPARLVAVVPVLGTGMRSAVEKNMERLVAAASRNVVVLPVRPQRLNLNGSQLGRTFQNLQFLPTDAQELGGGDLERSVAQATAQLATGSKSRIQVFVSHTKHSSESEGTLGSTPIYEQVRSVIAGTKLADFFDAHDLQSGQDWAAVLDEKASECALLMVRTDLYASREWTQREVLMAKLHDVPTVALVALTEGEARGSFLMDHMPTVPLDGHAPVESIRASLSRLVDESLKRALWSAQVQYVVEQGFDWAPVHAPEPVTAINWLTTHRADHADDRHLWIIHPDPPLGPAERRVTDELCALAGFDARVDILTPRTFAARGGVLTNDT
jgi:ligand-binding SRPBCC domain-containing protein